MRLRSATDLLRAAAVVLAMRRVVAKRPIGELVERLPTPSPENRSSGRQARRLGSAELEQVDRWATAVDRALRWMPGDAACLVRASALKVLLATDGQSGAAVRIGVRRGSGGFAAHAWVEVHGTPIAEPDGLRGAFSSLDGVTLR